jgi:hypothetical protein
MSKLKTEMSLLIGENGLHIEIMCAKSGVMFFEADVSPSKFCQMMGRLVHVKVDADVMNLDKVGKTLEMDTLRFEMPKDCEYNKQRAVAIKLAHKACPEGWQPDEYFGSQNSFYHKDGKNMAQTTIRRWV